MERVTGRFFGGLPHLLRAGSHYHHHATQPHSEPCRRVAGSVAALGFGGDWLRIGAAHHLGISPQLSEATPFRTRLSRPGNLAGQKGSLA